MPFFHADAFDVGQVQGPSSSTAKDEATARANEAQSTIDKMLQYDPGSPSLGDRFRDIFSDPPPNPGFREWAGENQTPASAWPLSQLLGGQLDRAALTGDMRPADQVLGELDKYFKDGAYRPTFGAGADDQTYYDDNAWIGIDLMQAYRQTHDSKYLDKVKELVPFMEGGLRDGGILWRDHDDKGTYNTCANAPAMQMFLALYQETGERRYLDDAKKCEAVMNGPLRREDGLYRDNISATDPNAPPGENLYSYNQGAAVGANLQMAEASTDPAEREHYLSLARQTGDAVLKKMEEDPEWLWKQPPSFNAVMFRNLLKLGVEEHDPRYRQALDGYLARADKDAKNPANGAYELGGIGRYDAEHAKGITLIDQSAFVQMFAMQGMSPEQLEKLG